MNNIIDEIRDQMAVLVGNANHEGLHLGRNLPKLHTFEGQKELITAAQEFSL